MKEVEERVEYFSLNHLPYIEFENDYLIADDSMGTVAGVEDINKIDVLAHEIRFADNEFYLPIEVKAECLVDYFIPKSEYWVADDDRKIHISDWNDYVYRAQERLPLKFSFTVNIHKSSIESDKLDLQIDSKAFNNVSVIQTKKRPNPRTILDDF